MIQHKSVTRFIGIPVMLTVIWTLLAGISPVLAAGPESNATQGQSAPLQFTSDGHVLAFANDSVTVASARQMLKTEFVNANPTIPQADNDDSGGTGKGGAAPLSRVTYNNLWDNVTVVYQASEGSVVESTYYLSPNKDGIPIDSIRLRYNRPVSLDAQGNLVIAYENGNILESAPVAWQDTANGRNPVSVSWALYGDNEAGFSLGSYLPGIPVVIDPWLTFLGGSGYDVGQSIAVDGSGNVYVTGDCDAAWGSPVRAFTSGDDAFVAKLNSNGVLQWNTFLGSGSDVGFGIAVDGGGNVYITGYSDATWGSPVRAFTSGDDAFVAKLNSSGTLQWNTFLGFGGGDIGQGIAVDGSGNVYVTGVSYATWGSPVRAYTANQEAFAAKLNNNGVLQWNTFLGGSSVDYGQGIAVDGNGNVYIVGYSCATWGSPVRAYTAGGDAFAAKLNSSGVLQWNTFLGGSSDDYGYGIAVDGSGNVYVTGFTTGTTWGSPVRAYASSYDAFAAKLDNSGALQWNTFLGGSGYDYGLGIAVDGAGNVYIVGVSSAAWGSPVRAYTSSADAFAVKLNGSGALQWNTFLGGSGSDSCTGIAVDGNGNIYIIGQSNGTWGSPVRALSGTQDAFVAKLNNSGSLAVTTLTVSGITAANKTYDNTTTVTLNTGSAALVGVTSPDVVTLNVASATGVFADENVGTGKTVTISGLTLGGADAANYTLTQPTTTANITARPISVTADASTKAYDGLLTSPGVPTITFGSIASGDSAPGWVQAYSDNYNVGTTHLISVTPAAVNDGNGGANYAVTYSTIATGIISPRPITVTADAQTKLFYYPDPALTYSITSGSLVGGDSFSGSLTRANAGTVLLGELPGTYQILIGSLTAGSNYNLNYVGALLTINPPLAPAFVPPAPMPTTTPPTTIALPTSTTAPPTTTTTVPPTTTTTFSITTPPVTTTATPTTASIVLPTTTAAPPLPTPTITTTPAASILPAVTTSISTASPTTTTSTTTPAPTTMALLALAVPGTNWPLVILGIVGGLIAVLLVSLGFSRPRRL